jgi:hypothetical protein
MPLPEDKAEQVLNALKSLDVQRRLDAINEARELYAQAFTPGMTAQEYAYSACKIEQYYNLIREELRVSQIRIKKELSSGASDEKPKAAKPKKASNNKPQPMDMGAMMAAFAAFKKD